MNFNIIQHVSFEGPGEILNWIIQKGHNYQIHRMDLGEGFPSIEETKNLIILGGPMSVHDDHAHPWLKKEKAFIADLLETDTKILGICLGSQLIAKVLSTPVFINRQKEIGWHPIITNPQAWKTLNINIPETIKAFHWHGDAYDIPYGADTLGKSEATKCQGYLLDKKILGLLFHPETNETLIKEMLTHGTKDLAEGGTYIQKKEIIEEQTKTNQPETQKLLFQILENFFKEI